MNRLTNRISTTKIAIATLLFGCGLAGGLCAQQSENHVLHAVPVPGAMNIDGKLDDWDLSGEIEVFANYRTRSTYSAKVAAMYDKDYFYLAILWRDPTPMQNLVDANFEIGSGWKSDCLQLRMLTDVPLHIDCWYSSTAKKSVVNIQYGSMRRDKGPLSMDKLVPFPAPNAIDKGVKEAFSMGEDGKSYIQEIAFPWKLITGQNVISKATGKPVAEPVTFKAGDEFHLGMEFLWGGPDGRTYPIHRYADLLKEGTSSREFFWEAENAWGPVKLEPAGHLQLPPPDYADRVEASQQKTSGPVKLSYTMPYDGFVTLVIEDEQGHRVKNLLGMAPRSKGDLVDFWDCTDEKNALVPPGKYHFRGLVHQGIEPVYDATYGTPGVPPWDNGAGTGAWMSDHKPPSAVAAAKDMMILAAERGESGYSIIGVGADGHKKWGDRTFSGINSIAADEQNVYVFLSAWDVSDPVLARMEARTGKYAPFPTTNGAQLKVSVFKKEEKHAWSPGIAVGPEKIAVALGGDMQLIRFFDKKTCAVEEDLPVPEIGPVAYDGKGTLYVWSAKKLLKVTGGKLLPFIDNVEQKYPSGIAFDAQGRVFLSDRETNQVRMYDEAGKYVRAIGISGGRPKLGKWQPDGMLNPSSVAVDEMGHIWVTEEDSSPKRVSVWDTDGKLITDYIGPTGYGGTGANADPDDKTRVFGSGCEFKLDYASNKAAVVSTLGDVSGQLMKMNGREYIMTKQGRLYLHEGDHLKLVAAMGNPPVKDLGAWKDIPLPPVPNGTHGYATISFIWSDLNDDGKPQPEEVESGSPWSGWKTMKYPVGVSGYFGSYWLDEKFNIVGIANESYGANGGRKPMITKTPLKGWTPGGAPIWDVQNQKLLSDDGKVQGAFYISDGGRNIAGSPITCVTDDGNVLWSYPDRWPGVHASHDAPIPERDDTLIGTLGCIGSFKTPLGTVFGLHSNMGRLYLMTTDGLFVASVFQDSRLGSDPWPSEARTGAPLGGVTMGSEWFGGHLFKSEKTNEYYIIAGFTAYNLIKLNGLDKMQALLAADISVTPEELMAGEKLQQQRAAKQAVKNTITIVRAEKTPSLDGLLHAFKNTDFVSWSAGPYKARAALSVDDANLYLAYEVQGDANPMVNAGKDVNQLFITGDSVDLQLGTDPSAKPDRKDPAPGDLRLLISVLDKQPVAVLYRWKTAAADKKPVLFSSPWRSQSVDRVDVIKDARINIVRHNDSYTVETAVPLSSLGFKPEAGKEYKLDLGVIYSDTKGDNRAARVYWSNKATGLTSDVPGEIMGNPNLWGSASLFPAKTAASPAPVPH